MKGIFKHFRRDIVAFISAALGIFVALSLVSYSPNDPSFNSFGAFEVTNIQNYCGYVGSLLADVLYQIFGLGAWLFVVSLAGLAYLIYAGKAVELKGLKLLVNFIFVLITSSLLHLYFGEWRLFEGQILVGGALGQSVSHSLKLLFNQLGTSLFLWTALAAFFLFYTEKKFGDIFQPILNKSKEAISWAIQLIERKRAAAKRVDIQREEKPAATDVLKKIFATLSKKEKEKKEDARAFESVVSEKFGKDFSAQESEGNIEEVEKDEESSFREISEETKKAFYGEGKGNLKEGAQKRKVTLKKRIKRNIERWELPSLELLEDPPEERSKMSDVEIHRRAKQLVEKLAQFRVGGEVVGACAGPVVTLFEFRPKADVKVSSITKLADDLSLALSSRSIRVIAPIPGRDVVGIETSNTVQETVYLKDSLAADEFWNPSMRLPISLGKQADGTIKIVDLAKMPHLLVAGTTGSGKSVFTVSSVMGLLFRYSPKDVKLILVDPKQVDLAAFEDIPHLAMPVIKSPKNAVNALKWAVREMEKRYRSMSQFGVRDITSFNEKVSALSSKDIELHIERHEDMQGGENSPTQSYYFEPFPYICIFIEEFGDLIAIDRTNVENSVVRLAQMARACGIHLVLATQSPRKDVVTGLIKTNISGRVSFKVASKLDSRIILDDNGAERLLTKGDMLFLAPGVSKAGRHHGPWISDQDISKTVQFWKKQWQPEYPQQLSDLAISSGGTGGDSFGDSFADDDHDDRYDEILAYVATVDEVSASLLQRRFRLGYPRAARLIEILEKKGVIGPTQGSKPRKVLLKT